MTYLLMLFFLSAPGVQAAELGPESAKFVDECRYILTPLESKMFASLDTEKERHQFIANFWKGLDPNPATDFNEYKQVYFQRMAEANRLFSRGVPGYLTDRGKVYMLLGKPDDKQSYYSGRRSDEHPSEIWTYRSAKHLGLDRDTEIAFVDETGTGNFRFSSKTALDAGAARAATIRGLQIGLSSLKTIAAVQANPRDASAAQAEHGVAPAAPTAAETVATPLAEPPKEFSGVISARYDFFKAFLGKTLLVMTVALDRGSNKGEGMDYKIFAKVERTDVPKEPTPTPTPTPTESPATGDDMSQPVMPPPEQTSFDLKDDFESRSSKRELLYQALLPLKPGKYRVTCGVTDIPGNATGSYNEEITVPDFSGDSLTLSSIVPATTIEEVKQDPALETAPEEKLVPFQLSGSTVVPCVNGTFSSRSELFVYFQGYGAAIDPASGKPKLNVDYLILRKMKSGKWKPIGRMPQPNQTELAHVYDLPLSQLPKGKADYKITVTVEDMLGGKKVKGETFFSVR